jgi:phosphomannomutase
MSESSNPTLIRFGTDGWRGIIADDFTFANVCRVTRAIARYLKTAYSQDRPVLVGYDTRFLAAEFANTAAEVLAEQGWRVKRVERDCPTPALAYSARQLNSAGALMFTASHNPAAYCGIKYIPDYGGPATTEMTDAIVAGLTDATDSPPNGYPSDRITSFDPRPDYLKFLYTSLDIDRIRAARLKVKYDALYSTSRGYLDTVLTGCGCEIETLHAYRDVLFGGSIPEPKGKQLTELAAAVQRDRANVGLATDGDSDRFGIVDERGQILAPNVVLLLLARHLIQKGKTGAIVRTVATTHLLDRLAEQHGLELIETPVGFKYIGQKMRELPVLLGGEESGGLSIGGHIPEKDGLLANMLVVEAIAYAGKPLSELAAEAIAEVNGPLFNHRLDLPLSHAHQTAVIEAFKTDPPTQVAGIRVKQVGLKDGVKLYLEDGSWLLLRASGTEPLLRVQIEAPSLARQNQIAADIEQAIHQI